MDKLEFWEHVPYKCLGIYFCVCGGTVAQAKLILQECFTEFDEAIIHGDGQKLHRVAHLILGKERECRKQLDAFLLHGDRLQDYPVAFVVLQEYALSKLVERSIEELHARI